MKTTLLSLFILFSLPVAAASHSLIVDGFYKVPVKNPSLEPYSLYEIKGLEVALSGSKMKITYRLPMALTGVDEALVYDGTAQQLSNYNGSMKCTESLSADQTLKNFECFIDYISVKINEEERDKAIRELIESRSQRLDSLGSLKQGFFTPLALTDGFSDFDAFVDVSKEFEEDPLGFIRFSLPNY